MRLSAEYGQLLWDNHEKDAAIKIYEELLELNPSDNQGLRYTLTNWLIDQNQLDKAKKLLKNYQEATTFMLFSELLVSIKEGVTSKKIVEKHRRAHKINPYVIQYLLRERELPEYMPDSYRFGSDDEAVVYCYDAIDVWEKEKSVIVKLQEIIT